MKIATTVAISMAAMSLLVSSFLFLREVKAPAAGHAQDKFQLFPSSNSMTAYKFNKQTGEAYFLIKEKEQRVFNPWEVIKISDPKDPLEMLDVFNKAERQDGPIGAKGDLKDISVFRAKYPQYDDVNNFEIASALHKKYYSYMKFGDFCKAIGVNAFGDLIPQKTTVDEVLGPETKTSDTPKKGNLTFDDRPNAKSPPKK